MYRDVRRPRQKIANSLCMICKFCAPFLRILRCISTRFFCGKIVWHWCTIQSIVVCWSTYRVLTTLENMEISGNLLILENSGNLKFTEGIYMILSLGHRVVCIIVSNSSVNWLSDTVTGVDRASHHAPSVKYSVILQESCWTDCYGDLLHQVFTLLLSGKDCLEGLENSGNFILPDL